MFKFIAFLNAIAIAFAGSIPYRRTSNAEYIVGGVTTNITQVPYQASLHLSTRFYCGASIITPTHVITAAHCVAEVYNQRIGYAVRVGSSRDGYGGDLVPVKKYTYHPKYTMNTMDYDVAVLELERPLKFDNTVQPIKLADKVPTDGAIVKASGWGFLKEGGVRPTYLQSVEIPMINQKTCEKNYEKYFKLTPRMICAGIEGKDACQGDSGGPLAYKNTLVGIVSTGLGCGRLNFPGIYTNVADPEVRQFIKQHSNL